MNQRLLIASLSALKLLTIATCQVLFIASIPVNVSVNIYFSSIGLTSAIYVILNQPFDLIFAPKIKSALAEPNSPNALANIIKLKIQALLFIFFVCTLSIVPCYFIAKICNILELSSWLLFITLGLVTSMLTTLNSQLLLLLRLKQRIAFASLVNSLMAIVTSALSLAMAFLGGIQAYAISYITLTFLFTIILFSEEPQAFPSINYKINSRIFKIYYSYFRLTILTKSVGLSENLSISLFCLNSATYYFMAKKAIASLLTILNEGYCQYVTVSVLNNLARHRYAKAQFSISRLRRKSISITLLYFIVFSLIYMLSSSFLGLISIKWFEPDVNNLLKTSAFCLAFTAYFCSNITGPTLSESVYALGMVDQIKNFISFTSISFAIMLLIGGWAFGVNAIIVLVSVVYIVNNFYFSKVVFGWKTV